MSGWVENVNNKSSSKDGRKEGGREVGRREGKGREEEPKNSILVSKYQSYEIWI